MSLFADINQKMQGRVALLSEEEAAALVDMVKGPGDHIDLGTLWGGTAILAALAKQAGGAEGKVYTIDFMQGGFWETGDPGAGGLIPTEKIIHDNLARFGVADRVVVVKASSYPWPLDDDVRPTSVFIDAGHDYEDCKRDWMKIRSLKPRFVAFHDYNLDERPGFYSSHPGVVKAVNEIINEDKEYEKIVKTGLLIILEYVEPEPAPEIEILIDEPSPLFVAPKAPPKLPVKPARPAQRKKRG